MPAPALTLHTDGYRETTRQPAHRHDALHLSLVVAGRVRETVGGVTEYAGPLSVVAKDAGVVHANDFGPRGARFIRLTLPHGLLTDLVDDVARCGGWRWTHDPAVARPFLRLAQRAGADRRRPVEADDPDLADLLAGFTARPAAPPRGRVPAWLALALERLREGWQPGLRVRDIAREAGVHPVYLARAMRRWYGITLGEELRRIRLRSALTHLLTANPSSTAAQAAHAAGFADEPHLCRALRQATGITPGELRHLMGTLPWHWRGVATAARQPDRLVS